MQNLRQLNRYKQFLDFKIVMPQTKQVEDRGTQSFIETASENEDAGHAVLREKYSEGRNCIFLDADVALLGLLYRSSAFFRRKTYV